MSYLEVQKYVPSFPLERKGVRCYRASMEDWADISEPQFSPNDQ